MYIVVTPLIVVKYVDIESDGASEEVVVANSLVWVDEL